MSDQPPYAQLSKGTFLIASPDIDSGAFFRSVLLICEHSSNGSFGLIINKPLDLELPEELQATEERPNPNIFIRTGGPTQTNQLMLIHNSETIPEQTLKLCEGVYLGGDLPFLQNAINDQNGPSMLLCFGYSSWGAGQLEREFLDGAWFLCPASAEHLFHTPPEKLWQTLLRSMGGKYAIMSMIPEDLSLN